MLSEKITWLLDDHDLHRTMSERAVEYAQDYAWEKIAGQVVNVYKELLEKDPVPVQSPRR
jgi:glycosyltransferase involved in cell wall biosynthesis